MSAAETLGTLLPQVVGTPPGPNSRAMSRRLARVESRNVTHLADDWPVFWQEAAGSNVRDVDDNVYIDLTSAFGVALLGHGSAPLLRALDGQRHLIHGMGDIHPPDRKLDLLERLAELSPWPGARTILASSGSEAVEAALKTARLASGRPGVLAFEGGYHGLTLGSLAATERSHFRTGFAERLYAGVAFAPFPDTVRDSGTGGEASLDSVRRMLGEGAPNGDPIGTIVLEPVQARGGCRIPPEGYLAELRAVADEHDVLIVADEIFTGLGRCGAMLASEAMDLTPDVLCVGKALGAGLPISACLAPAEVMDAWPSSDGEAIHTSTFLGHPLSCAAAVEVLDEIQRTDVPAQARRVGGKLLDGLRRSLAGHPAVADVRGMGLLLGVELVDDDGHTPRVGAGAKVARRALREGLIVLPAGDVGHVVELTPPVTLSEEQVDFVVETLARVVREVA
ncbi:MAG: aspartate aminotransferase family protein [Longimicrobiales bacterium]|nr:aspartate aminotransferase family protein [Longimicrobiales bacterium]